MYIVVEGLEGAGKSTVLRAIEKYFKKALGVDSVVTVREPGGTPVAERLRAIVKDSSLEETLSDKTECLLMYAARSQLHECVIQPALKDGKVVLGDRGNLSSKAYQGAGRGLSREVRILSELIVGDYEPDLTIYIDIEPEIGLERASGRGVLDRIEQNDLSFFVRARNFFLEEVGRNPNVMMIDGSKSMLDVEIDAVRIIRNALNI